MSMSNRKKKSTKLRYFPNSGLQNGKRSNLDYCSDKRLVPRIKQYLEDNAVGGVNIEDMAVTLQAQYPEYARKKRLAFRALVAKVYSGTFLNGSAFLSTNASEPEEWLERREREHVMKRREGLDQEDDQFSNDSASVLLNSSDSEAEMEAIEDFNLMNNSILQLYGSSRPIHTSPQTTTVPSPLTTAPTDHTPTIPPLTENSPSGTLPCGHNVQSDPYIEPTENKTDTCRTANSLSNGVDTDTITGQVQVEKLVKVSTNEGKELAGRENTSSQEREPRLKRSRRTDEEGVADGVKPRKKRAKGKGKGMERNVESVTEKELEGKRSQEFKVQTSTVRFSDVGGCESALGEVCRLLLHLRHPELFTQLGVRPPQGFLLHGPPGCGKTLLAHAIAGELQLPFIKLAATEIVSGVSGESESSIRDLFQVAKEHAPCVLFVDEVDAICPKRETAQREMERRIVTQLLACLDDLNQSDGGRQVLVIGATSRTDSLDPALRRSGRFDREICLGIPSIKERESILRLHCASLQLEEGFDYSRVSADSPGFVGADLVALVREASLCTINRLLARSRVEASVALPSPLEGTLPSLTMGTELMSIIRNESPFPNSVLDGACITQDDFREALRSVQPSAKREGFVTVPNITWDDVGALEDIREELTMAILAPVRYPDQFSQLGLTSPPGVLLAGPPGCGKTLLAKAIANESGINFISVKGPELLNMYVGESERAVRQVFERARNSAPCVIFFDELDALCPRRSDVAESSASSRVVNQLLTEMDGLESRKQVFVMGATNRPDIIDPAVLRPGRLDKILFVGLPSAKDREAILKTITKNSTRPRLDPDVSLPELASDDCCRGFSGADLNALVREAAIVALKEFMKLNPLTDSTHTQHPPTDMLTSDASVSTGMVVSMRHFRAALTKFRPSVSAGDCLFYQKMAAEF